MRFEARLKPEYRHEHPELSGYRWYPVVPLWPGLTQRTRNMSGQRLARLKTAHDYTMLRADHLEFRTRPSGEAEAAG
ncbi:MAG: hypothetical protein ACREMZ_05665 [Gemmatimonadales bacterium]